MALTAAAPTDPRPRGTAAARAPCHDATSAIAGLLVLDQHWDTHGLLGAAWPFVVAAAAAALLRASAPMRSMAAFTAGAIVALAPTAEALVHAVAVALAGNGQAAGA